MTREDYLKCPAGDATSARKAIVLLVLLCLGALSVSCVGSAASNAVYWPEDASYTNVRDTVAKGDGVSDDTAALKVANARKGGICFPPDTYLVSDTISATPKRYFIQGAGPGKTTIGERCGDSLRSHLRLVDGWFGGYPRQSEARRCPVT